MRFARVSLILLILAAGGGGAVVQEGEFEWSSRLGIIIPLEGGIYFATKVPNLIERPRILFVGGEGAEVSWIHGEARKLERDSSAEPLVLIEGNSSLLYRLYISDKTNSPSQPGFGVLMSRSEPHDDREPSLPLDLDGDGVSEFFYQCTSRESLHLMIRSGDRLSGETGWRAYYYLGYDVEPTCREEDFDEARSA